MNAEERPAMPRHADDPFKSGARRIAREKRRLQFHGHSLTTFDHTNHLALE